MALAEIYKVRIRKHLRYGVAGLYKISPAGGTFAVGQIGYRFFQAYGNLEYRMNNMSPVEEALITGLAIGSVAYIGQNPAAGDQFTLNLSGGGLTSPQQITITAAAGDNTLTISNKMAVALSANQVLATAGFYAVGLYGTGQFGPNVQQPLPEMAVLGPQPFQMTVSTTSTVTGTQVVMQGEQLPPYADLVGNGTLTWGYVPLLDALEAALIGASQNLDTKRADVWYHHGNELAQRRSLYADVQLRLAEFMGIPVNSDVPGGAFKRIGVVRYV